MVDLQTAFVSALVPLTVVTIGAVIKWRDDHVKLKAEFEENKINVAKNLDDHKKDDKEMFQQVLDRIELSETNIINILREK